MVVLELQSHREIHFYLIQIICLPEVRHSAGLKLRDDKFKRVHLGFGEFGASGFDFVLSVVCDGN